MTEPPAPNKPESAAGGAEPSDPDAPDHPAPADGSATPPPVRRSRIHPNGYAMPGPYANTTGIILPKTQSAPAGNNTNPSGGAETEAEQDWWQRWGSDTLHGILDVAGLVPVLGEGADLINAGIYLAEGDKINASLSAAAAIPFAGWGATTIKAAKRTNDAVEAAVKSAKVSGKVAEAAAKGSRESAQAISRHADEAGGYILRKRMKEHEVPCFRKGKGNRASDIEYDRQLKAQQDALNQMSVGDYLTAREAYQRFGRHPDAAQKTAQFKKDFETDQREKIKEQKILSGMDEELAATQAAREAADMMKGLDALHTPDMVAGGYHSPTPTGMGNASANRSIGSQWPQNTRVAGLDAAAREAVGELGETAAMNVKLTRCLK